LAAGWWESRHALTCVRRIGAIGLPTPNVKRPATANQCPLLAQSGHARAVVQCPLLGVKRT
jgi:hypothetical protein